MKIKTLTDLYVDQLQDMHSAEKQLTKALPKMAKAASSPELKTAFTDHLAVTKEQLARVEKLLAGLGKTPGRKVCEATVGLVKEGSEMIDEGADEEVLDAGLIVAAQKVEHYEIASYGCLRTFANLLDRPADAKLLEKTLQEEKDCDEALTELATSVINAKAMA